MKPGISAVLLLLATFFFSHSASAGKSDSFAATVALGEALVPSHFRLSFDQFDIGFDGGAGKSLFGGIRTWKGSHYSGFGLGTDFAPNGFGWYGRLGYEWRYTKVAGMIFEFNGYSHFHGTTRGYSLIGVIVGW